LYKKTQNGKKGGVVASDDFGRKNSSINHLLFEVFAGFLKENYMKKL